MVCLWWLPTVGRGERIENVACVGPIKVEFSQKMRKFVIEKIIFPELQLMNLWINLNSIYWAVGRPLHR